MHRGCPQSESDVHRVWLTWYNRPRGASFCDVRRTSQEYLAAGSSAKDCVDAGKTCDLVNNWSTDKISSGQEQLMPTISLLVLGPSV
jgi:hypothetical protein